MGAIIRESTGSGVSVCSDEICDELLCPMSNRALQGGASLPGSFDGGPALEILEKKEKCWKSMSLIKKCT